MKYKLQFIFTQVIFCLTCWVICIYLFVMDRQIGFLGREAQCASVIEPFNPNPQPQPFQIQDQSLRFRCSNSHHCLILMI